MSLGSESLDFGLQVAFQERLHRIQTHSCWAHPLAQMSMRLVFLFIARLKQSCKEHTGEEFMTRLELSVCFDAYDHFVARPSRVSLLFSKIVKTTGLPVSNELALHKESDEHRRLGTEEGGRSVPLPWVFRAVWSDGSCDSPLS